MLAIGLTQVLLIQFPFRIVDGIAIFKYWLPYKPEVKRKPYQHLPADIGSFNESHLVPHCSLNTDTPYSKMAANKLFFCLHVN